MKTTAEILKCQKSQTSQKKFGTDTRVDVKLDDSRHYQSVPINLGLYDFPIFLRPASQLFLSIYVYYFWFFCKLQTIRLSIAQLCSHQTSTGSNNKVAT